MFRNRRGVVPFVFRDGELHFQTGCGGQRLRQTLENLLAAHALVISCRREEEKEGILGQGSAADRKGSVLRGDILSFILQGNRFFYVGILLSIGFRSRF